MYAPDHQDTDPNAELARVIGAAIKRVVDRRWGNDDENDAYLEAARAVRVHIEQEKQQ